MKPQYQHELMTSFFLWFDHELLDKGEAYSNKTGTLFAQSDSRLPNSFISAQSNYKQWVNDSSITGEVNPVIPTAFEGSGRADNIIFDFENGRIIETGGAFSVGDTLTGTFAVKDFNVYLTNETEEGLIIENKFKLNSRYGIPTISGIEPYDQVTPAIFLNVEFSRNEGFALGGMDQTNSTIKAVILADDEYQLDGALSIFADSARKVVPKIPFTGHPSTEYGDIKGGSYNYTGLANTYADNAFFIDDVTVSKFSQRAQSSVPGDIKVGFIDFDISTQRFPRQ
jgi:hypothetical protein